MSVHEIRRFLCITSYFRRFIPYYAIKANNLSGFTRKSQKSEEKQEKANSTGLARILLQLESEKELHPSYYVSKKTTDVVSKYHSSKLELMAIVWCIRRLHNLLIGLKFQVFTDCQAIFYFNVARIENTQVLRWFNLLLEYNQ